MTDNNREKISKKRRKVLQAIAGSSVVGVASQTASASESNHLKKKVKYKKLSAKAKRKFQQALDHGKIRDYVYDFPSELYEYSYVIFHGETYKLNMSYSYEAKYDMRSNQIDKADIPPSTETIEYSQLSSNAKQAFNKSTNQDRYKTKGNLPEQLFDYEFVSHHDNIYKIELMTADITIFTISPEKV